MNNQAAQTMPTLPRPYWKAGDVKDDYGNPYNETDLFTDDDMRAMYQQGYAAALAQTAGVADGWKLVPVEPTEVMCEAAMSSLGWTRSEAAAKTAPITPASPMMEGSMKVWSAMLATAPAASAKYCSDERPCTPCFSNNGPCEDAPAASGVDTSTNEAWAARAQEKIEAMEAASGGEDDMCPNCVTPWKCNGPHESTGGASVSERARDDLHVAICQAVALMNMEPMTTAGLLQAHDILRKAIS